jgi:Protein of unknown function (DUF1761)
VEESTGSFLEEVRCAIRVRIHWRQVLRVVYCSRKVIIKGFIVNFFITMIPINYWAVLVSAIVNMVLGSLWFGPVFGKAWSRSAGMTPEKMDAAKKSGMHWSYFLMFVGSLLMAFILAHAVLFTALAVGMMGISAGLVVGFVAWIGLVAPVTIGVVLWDGKPWKYWAITYLYYLIGFMVMGGILGGWM